MGAAEAIAFARAQLGKPYVFGATGPDSYDCSGLVQAACKAGGASIPRVTYDQIFAGSEVARNDLLPGDLVFPDIGHVQMYTGNNMVIEAPHTGAFVQEVQLWGFWRARRVFSDGTNVTGQTDATTVGLKVTPASWETGAVKVLGYLVSPTWWMRAGVFIGGIVIIILALYWYNHTAINRTVVSTAKTVGEAAVFK